MIKVLLALGLLVGAVGCSQKKHDFVKRDRAFFDRLINPASSAGHAEEKLGTLKLVEGSEIYNMRYALFDDGRFYYQVNNLGSGYGSWKFKDGVLNLFAPRAMFDLDLYISAARSEGDALLMQFTDRFGANLVNVNFRDLSEKPVKKLPEFKENQKGL